MKRLIVGVTGSPGSGKTTVTKLFHELGAYVVDVDRSGKWIVDNNLLVRQRIRENFGDNIFLSNGYVNRKKLGDIVFSDREKRQQLDSIVHPMMVNRVRAQFQTCLYDYRKSFIVVDAALLIELSLHCEMDLIIVVTCPLKTRLNRLSDRHNISLRKARQITNAQLSQEEKLQFATRIIDNSKGINDLKYAVSLLNDELIQNSLVL